jgi:acyl transferase domain-containing protein/7-keto-8-aminopelargonate synthetase-like enzyme/acyl carrier protein
MNATGATQPQTPASKGLEPIAVVGMACRFPGGADPDEFWNFLARGGDAVREIPAERWDIDAYYDPDPDAKGKMYTRSGAFVSDFDHFSAAFFGISPREAQFMDPQQRQLLEVHWEALENAGIVPQRLSAQQLGVFVGIGTTDYGDLLSARGPMGSDAYNGTGGSHAAAAGRLSYLLGVRGPSLAVDTACSSSLVTVHLAMMSLRSGESDIALASGVTLNFAPDVFISLCKARMLSPDGRCKTFDASANGYVRGEGCGVLVLKRLSDAVAAGDNVLALLRGSATNHNGRSSGLTVPSGPAQQEVIRTALRNAGVDPSEIGFVEAHGTGTAVGDPIEAGALGAVFAGRSSPLLVGSVKTNCGHLEWAAGVCGLIKVILSMDRGVIPPNLHFRQPNPMIPWDKLPIRIVTEPTPWPDGKRLAGVSSFGFGGTNAHVVVEQAPARPDASPAVKRPMHVLALSAKSEAALRRLADRMAEAADRVSSETLGNFCYSANTGRSQFEYRLAMPTGSNRDLAAGLREFAGRVAARAVKTGRQTQDVPGLAMVFTGQGSQRPGMGRKLYETQPLFRRVLEHCDALLCGSLDRPLLELLYAESDPGIDQTRYTQPALFAIEYALAQLWQSWGVVPDAVLGHSVGEYVAACIAGVFDLADALKLIAARGRLMQALPHDGAMFAVRAGEARVAPLLEPFRTAVSFAAVNGPDDVVISGEARALESIAAVLRDQGVHVQRLNVSHAFHSPLMEPMLEEFAAIARAIPFHQPRLTLISNVTGREVGEEIAHANYWVRHVRQTVRFADSIQTAAANGCGIFLEAGPQPVLCGMGRLCLPSGNALWLPSLHSKRGDWAQMLDSAAELWVRGGAIDWDGFDREYPRRKIALPTYPFERQRYWFPTVGAGPSQGQGALRPLVESLSRSPLVKETVFSASLGVPSQPYLADHKVHGQVVVPGAAYLAMLASGAELLGWPSCHIEDVYFLAPLVLPDEKPRMVQAVLTPVGTENGASQAQTVLIAALPSDTPGDEMVRLMSGRISPGVALPSGRADLASLQARCRESFDPERLYEIIGSSGVDVQGSFRWIDKLWLGSGEALAQLRLPDAVGSMDGYRLHPALLDASFQVAGATLDKEEQSETLLPFSIKALRQERAATGTSWWCHAVRTGSATWDVQTFDSDGNLVVALEGFEMRKAPAAAFLRRRLADWLYRVDWQPQRVVAQGAAGPATWLLLDNGSPIGAELAQRLASRGDRCLIVSEGDAFHCADSRITVDPMEPGDFRRLLDLSPVIHLWGASQGTDHDPAERAQCLAIGMLHLVQAVAAGSAKLRSWVVTAGAQAVEPGETVNPEQAPLWGMVRGLMQEAPELQITCIDAGSGPAGDAWALLAELDASPGESQVAYRGVERFVARLIRCPDAVPPAIEGPFRLQLKEYGSPDNLQLAPMTRQKPGRKQVEIAVKATALNFRDVVIALGMLKDFYAREMGIERASDIPLGFDCAGIVSAVGEGVTDLAVGDEVMSPAVGGAASHVIAFREAVMRTPKGVDHVTAASLPSVFWTAYHSLVQLAQLKAGERVLIHAAAGGVGLAAIQIAQAAGAEIFATASPGKWDYLKSQGIVHIMNSRTLDFADEILRATGGKGVDVVLNSLTGAALERSFSVLKQNGRFVEIGKLGGGMPEEAVRRPDAAYFTFELGAVIARDPVVSTRTGEQICALFETGVLRPLPVTTFAIDNAAEAYRFMQQTKHIGKVVLPLGEASTVRDDASYLVTGGLGGLGLKVADYLVSAGARHLVLAGRSGASPGATSAIEEMRRRGASVEVFQGDVSAPEDAAAMIDACQRAAPLHGVIHAAGVLREALVRNQSADSFASAMAPKVRGGWELHRLTRGMPLDFFVCFSSMASLTGSPGQANYAAANAFLDSMATMRRAQGLPAVSIQWGPWADVGMAAGLEFGSGIEKLSVDDGIDAFRTFLKPRRGARGEIGVMKVRWDVYTKRWPSPESLNYFSALLGESRGAALALKDDFLKTLRSAPEAARRRLLEEHIHEAVRQVLGLSASYDIKNGEAWTTLGVDSLMMVEIKNRLESSLRLTFPMELLMRDVNIQSVTDFALDKLAAAPVEATPPGQSTPPEDPVAIRFEIRESLRESPQFYAEADDQRGRQILIDGRWRCDFASCNYLGFDLEPEIKSAIGVSVERWGTHPSWTRAVASPALYSQLERELAKMVGAPDTLVFPSISLLHLGVLPALAGYNGVILKDAESHHSIAEACMRAQADGTEWVEFRHNDIADLESKLAKYARARTKIIATDGVYSMGSSNPPLPEYARLAREYNATVYVDDAHGFGIVGAAPDEDLPYGYGGVGIVPHLGLDYERDRIIYVAGMSKAFSSYAAFVTCQDEKMKMMLQTTGPYVFSGPTAVACLATALAGLRLNRRDGDVRRRHIHRLTSRLVREAVSIGFEVDNDSNFPIVGVVMGGWEEIVTACRTLWDHDILITPATFPAVPATRNLVRFSITAANTEQEIDQAIRALDAVWEALHPAAADSPNETVETVPT